MYWASRRQTENVVAPAARTAGWNPIWSVGMLSGPPTCVNATWTDNWRENALSAGTEIGSEGCSPHGHVCSAGDVPQQAWDIAVWRCVAEPCATMSKSLSIDCPQASHPYVPASICATASW